MKKNVEGPTKKKYFHFFKNLKKKNQLLGKCFTVVYINIFVFMPIQYEI